MKIYLIVATDQNSGIGLGGKMPWHFSSEMKHFTQITKGHTVIMGRKTWESLPEKFRPLPERQNIVVTSQQDYQAPGAELADSLESALSLAKDKKVFIIGGGAIYQQSMELPGLTGIYKTEIQHSYNCDTFFPKMPDNFKPELQKEEQENGITLRYYLYS